MRKTCTEAGYKNICSNIFGRKCYSYIYPRITTTVEDSAEDNNEPNFKVDVDLDAERFNNNGGKSDLL